MSNRRTTTTLTSEREVLRVLTDLCGKSWLSRGQSKRYGNLLPSIDRQRVARGSQRTANFSNRLRKQIAQGDTLVPGPSRSESFIAQRRHLTRSLF